VERINILPTTSSLKAEERLTSDDCVRASKALHRHTSMRQTLLASMRSLSRSFASLE
jgi:hypothetical protein